MLRRLTFYSRSGRKGQDMVMRVGASPRVMRLAGIAVAAVLLTSCGGGSSDRPSVTPTRSVSLPTTIPSATRTPIRSETPASTSRPTLTSGPTAAPEPTQTEPPAAVQSSEPGSASDTTSVPSWVWWLLAAAVIAAAVTIPLVARARRRNRWAADFAAMRAEAAWFARVLLPELRAAGSAEHVAGGWAVGASRIASLEDGLVALEATAPDDARQLRARSLRDAVRTAREHMQRLVIAGAHADVTRELDTIAARLEEALASIS